MTCVATRDLDIVPLICEFIARRAKIQREDVLALAKFFRRDIGITNAEAEAVFILAARNFPATDEWEDYFVKTMGGWVVEEWAGKQLDADKANQLIAWLGGHQAHLSQTQSRLLTNVLEQVSDCPEQLLSFADAWTSRAISNDSTPVMQCARAG